MPLDETKKIFPEDFEYHADVGTIRAFMSEVIKEGYDMGTARMRGNGWGRRGDETLEQLDFVKGGFCVSGS